MTESPDDDLSIAGLPVKCVVVGDAEVGKTCLMLAFVRQDSSFVYTPSSVDSYTVGMTVDNQRILLFLQDTAGSESYDEIRHHCYPGSQVIVIVFSLIAESTLDNVVSKWKNEVQTFAKNCPILLVGTFSDLAEDHSAQSEKAKRVAAQIGAAEYMEICSTSHSQATEVFTAAARIGGAISAQLRSSPSYLSLTLVGKPTEVKGEKLQSKSPAIEKSSEAAVAILSPQSTPSETEVPEATKPTVEPPGKLLTKEVSSPHLLKRKMDLSTAARVETPLKETSEFVVPEVPAHKSKKHTTSSLREIHSKKQSSTSLSTEKKSHSIGSLEHPGSNSEEKHASSLRISITSADEDRDEKAGKKKHKRKEKTSPKTPKRHKEADNEEDDDEPKRLTRDVKSPSESEISKAELHRTESTPYMKSLVRLNERRWKARSMMPSMIDIVAAQPRLPPPQYYDASPNSNGSPLKSPLASRTSLSTPPTDDISSDSATPMAVEEVIRSPTVADLKPFSPDKNSPIGGESANTPSLKVDVTATNPPLYSSPSPRSLLQQCMTNVNIAVSQNPLFNVWVYRGIGLTLTAEPWGESSEHYLLKLKTRADKCRMYFLKERNKKAFKTLIGPGSLLAVQDSSRFFVLNLPVPIGLGFKSHDESGRFVIEYMKKMYEARNFKGKRSVFFRRKSGDRFSPVTGGTQPVPISPDGRQSPFSSQPEYDVYESLEGHFVAALQNESQVRQKPHHQRSESDEKRVRENERAVNTAIAAAKPTLRATVSQTNLLPDDLRSKVDFKLDSSPKAIPREGNDKSSPRPKSHEKNDRPSPKSPQREGAAKSHEKNDKHSPKPSQRDDHAKSSPSSPHRSKTEKPPPLQTGSSTSPSPSASPHAQSSPKAHTPDSRRPSSKIKKMDEHFLSSAMKRTSRSIRGVRARNDLLRTSAARSDDAFRQQTLEETRRVLERLMMQHSNLTVFSPCLNNAYYEEDSSSSDEDEVEVSDQSELTSPIIDPLPNPTSSSPHRKRQNK